MHSLFQHGIGYRYHSKDNNHFICNLLLYKEHVAHKMASTGAYPSTSETRSRNEQKEEQAWVINVARPKTEPKLTESEFWWHILSGCWVYDWGIQYHMCSASREDSENGCLSGCCNSLAKYWQLKLGILHQFDSSDYQPIHFLTFPLHNLSIILN